MFLFILLSFFLFLVSVLSIFLYLFHSLFLSFVLSLLFLSFVLFPSSLLPYFIILFLSFSLLIFLTVYLPRQLLVLSAAGCSRLASAFLAIHACWTSNQAFCFRKDVPSHLMHLGLLLLSQLFKDTGLTRCVPCSHPGLGPSAYISQAALDGRSPSEVTPETCWPPPYLKRI